MFTLIVVVRDPASAVVQELTRQFDPATAPAALQTKWNALGPAVLTMITALQAAAAADPNAPPLL